MTNTQTDALDGFTLLGAATLNDSASDLLCPANNRCRGVFAGTGATATVRDSYLSATVGAPAVGDRTVRRTRIVATQGVVASSGSQPTVADTMIRVPGSQASNFRIAGLAAAGDGTTHLDADRDTIYGNGTGFGIWSVPNGGAGKRRDRRSRRLGDRGRRRRAPGDALRRRDGLDHRRLDGVPHGLEGRDDRQRREQPRHDEPRPPGNKTLTWDGRLAGKPLKKGSYRATAIATDSGGLKSAALVARFKIKG